jgi:8-oxo-dGTP pyrophosphatase MutT (NUDIX family)
MRPGLAARTRSRRPPTGSDLQRWRSSDAQRESWRLRCLDLVRPGDGAALDRTRSRDHVTASCVVLSQDLSSVLLTLHSKIGLWLQLGGHLEPGDATVPDAARREAREESGICDLELATDLMVDLERQDVGHVLAGCSVHWDAAYLAIASRHAQITISPESHQLRWWPVTDLPSPAPTALPQRIARAVAIATLL